MTLDEAIEHAELVADSCEGECADDHMQLAYWLRELRRARMEIDLLKTLRDGFKADAKKYKAENDKLRDLIYDIIADEERGHNDDRTFYEHVIRAHECGIAQNIEVGR